MLAEPRKESIQAFLAEQQPNRIGEVIPNLTYWPVASSGNPASPYPSPVAPLLFRRSKSHQDRIAYVRKLAHAESSLEVLTF